MDKNTIIAIVLSTVVIIASYFLMPIFFPGMYGGQSTGDEATTEETASAQTNQTATDNSSAFISSDFSGEENESESIPEEIITINTNKAEIVLTNKGGDIISYKLKEYEDKATGTGVQISDSINDFNRTCAVAFGNANAKILDDTFSVEKIDSKTVLFKKNVTVNRNGENKTFVFGKKYSFKDDEDVFKLDIMLHDDEDMSYLNQDGSAYTLRTAPQIGPHFNPKENKYENRQFISYDGKKVKRQILGTNQFTKWTKQNGFIWTAIAGKYFVEILVPTNPDVVNAAYYSSMIEKDNYANAQAVIERKNFSGSDITDTYYLYFGPRDEKVLKRYNVARDDKGNLINAWDFGGKRLTEALQSSGWLGWLEKILKVVLELIYKVVKNWGVAIIVLTILLKVVMFPLSKKQSMSTLKMQEIQPQIQALQEKYKDNQQKLQMEMAKIYKEANYNPASGCLPMIFQMLVLFAMYNMFNYKFEFYQAMFIPKWIPDLSAGDSVYKFGFSIPFLGNQLRLLPIIYVVTQLFFGKITQYGGSTAGQNQNAASMKFMMYGMPIMFFFLFYNAPSGLLIYWIVSNLFQMIQQIVINKMMAKKRAEMAAGKKIENQQKTLPPKNKRK